MASDNEASCVNDPNFAIICAFFQKFGALCGVECSDMSELQTMIEDTEEVHPYLRELHVKLLRKLRKTVNMDKWEGAVVKFCHSYSNQDAWEIERFGYKKSNLTVKLRILKNLVERQFDSNTKFRTEVSRMSATELRSQPVGRDSHGNAYWSLVDDSCNIRVYKEDLDEETWKIAAYDRDGLVQLIDQLSGGSSTSTTSDQLTNEDSNSISTSISIQKANGDTQEEELKLEQPTDTTSFAKSHEINHINGFNGKIEESNKLLEEENDNENTTPNNEMDASESKNVPKNTKIGLIKISSVSKINETVDLFKITNTTPNGNNNAAADTFQNDINYDNKFISDNAVKKSEVNTDSSSDGLDLSISKTSSENICDRKVEESSLLSDPLRNKRRASENTCVEKSDELKNQIAKKYKCDDSNGIEQNEEVDESQTEDDFVGEAIEEPVMFVSGTGSGQECDAGNPEKESGEATNAGTSTNESKDSLSTNSQLQSSDQKELTCSKNDETVTNNSGSITESLISQEIKSHTAEQSENIACDLSISKLMPSSTEKVEETSNIDASNDKCEENINDRISQCNVSNADSHGFIGDELKKTDSEEHISPVVINNAKELDDINIKEKDGSIVEDNKTDEMAVEEIKRQNTPNSIPKEIDSLNIETENNKINDTLATDVTQQETKTEQMFFFGKPGCLQLNPISPKKSLDSELKNNIPIFKKIDTIDKNTTSKNVSEETSLDLTMERIPKNNLNLITEKKSETEEFSCVKLDNPKEDVNVSSTNSITEKIPDTETTVPLQKSDSVNNEVNKDELLSMLNKEKEVLPVLEHETGSDTNDETLDAEYANLQTPTSSPIISDTESDPKNDTEINLTKSSLIDDLAVNKPSEYVKTLDNILHVTKDITKDENLLTPTLDNNPVSEYASKDSEKDEPINKNIETMIEIKSTCLNNKDDCISEKVKEVNADNSDTRNLLLENDKCNTMGETSIKKLIDSQRISEENDEHAGNNSQECLDLSKMNKSKQSEVDNNIKESCKVQEQQLLVVHAKSSEDNQENAFSKEQKLSVHVDTEKPCEENEIKKGVDLTGTKKQKRVSSPRNMMEDSSLSLSNVSEISPEDVDEQVCKKSKLDIRSNNDENKSVLSVENVSKISAEVIDEEVCKKSKLNLESNEETKSEKGDKDTMSQASSDMNDVAMDVEDESDISNFAQDDSQSRDISYIEENSIKSFDINEKLVKPESILVENIKGKSAGNSNSLKNSDVSVLDDVDPLACADVDLTAQNNADENIAELSIPTVKRTKKSATNENTNKSKRKTELEKLNLAKTVLFPNTRKRRISDKNESSMESEVSDEECGGKRRKLRQKKIPDKNIKRKSKDDSAPVVSSSEEEKNKKSPKVQSKASTPEPVEMAVENNRRSTRSKLVKEPSKVAVKKKAPTVKSAPTNKLVAKSSTVKAPSTAKATSTVVKETPIVKSVAEPNTVNSNRPCPRRFKKKILGLEVETDVIEKITDEPESNVRQSRRIAQLKIREEAERRKVEEITLQQLKEQSQVKKKIKGKDDGQSSEKRKRKQPISVSASAESSEAESGDSGKPTRLQLLKKKKRDTARTYNEAKPWQSSSDNNSSSNEEEEEEPDYHEPSEEEAAPVLKSDHEFSPESDLEGDDGLPLRRARTVKCDDAAIDETDSYRCQRCGKSDHPEWILLCDSCDCGYHCSCLKPVLFVIPEGDWFCPPCQHNKLITGLQFQLVEFDKMVKKKDNEELRKQRLAFVGISLNNVIQDEKKPKEIHEKKRISSDSESSGSSESETDSDAPIYKFRERRQTNLNYRFNDYDDLINSAIKDEMEEVKGAGNMGRGKDISTIIEADKEEKEEEKKNKIAADRKKDDDNLNKNDEDKERDPESKNEQKEKGSNTEDSEDSDSEPIKSKTTKQKKKHRKLNSLELRSSEDDNVSDEDFKGSSSDSEDEADSATGDSESDLDMPGRRRGGRRTTRRSTRARVTRYDQDFINDSDSMDAPKRKKTRRNWSEEDETEESDSSDDGWRSKKSRRKAATRKKISEPSSNSNKSRRRKRNNELTDLLFRGGGIGKKKTDGTEEDHEDSAQTRRTRGKKINYVDALATDSEEERSKKTKKRTPKKIESEEEYVAQEEESEADESKAEIDKEGIDETSEKKKDLTEPQKQLSKNEESKGVVKKLQSKGEELSDKLTQKEESILKSEDKKECTEILKVPTATENKNESKDKKETVPELINVNTEVKNVPVVKDIEKLNILADLNIPPAVKEIPPPPPLLTVAPAVLPSTISPLKLVPSTKLKIMTSPKKSATVGLKQDENQGQQPPKITIVPVLPSVKNTGSPSKKKTIPNMKLKITKAAHAESEDELDDEEIEEEELEEDDEDFGEEDEGEGTREGSLDFNVSLDEEKMEKLMEEEEFANKQLQMAGLQIAKEKRRKEALLKKTQKEERKLERLRKKEEKQRLKEEKIKEREAKRLAKLIAPISVPGEPKKRGRKSKIDHLPLINAQPTYSNLSNVSVSNTSQDNSMSLMSPDQNLLRKGVDNDPEVSSADSMSMSSTSTTVSNLDAAVTSSISVNTSISPTASSSCSPVMSPSTSMIPSTGPMVSSTISPRMPMGSSFPGTPSSSASNSPSLQQMAPTGFYNTPQKRRGRGRGKKTLAAEAAAAAAAMGHRSKEGIMNTSMSPAGGGKLGVAAPPQPFNASHPTPSVITRMLQNPSGPLPGVPGAIVVPPGPRSGASPGPHHGTSSPGIPSGLPPQGFMSGKFYPPGHTPGDIPPGQYLHRPRGTPQPHYRPPGNIPPMYSSPPVGLGSPSMYHSPHHPLDPSPSGGGPISINQGPRSPNAKGATPPPPYNRRYLSGEIPRPLMPPFQHTMGHLQAPLAHGSPPMSHPTAVPVQPNLSPGLPGMPMTHATPSPVLSNTVNTGPPLRPQFSTFTPAYPYTYDQPPIAQQVPPEAYEGESQEYEEEPEPEGEGEGEFGGLVSYFSSQREDDLDS